MLLAPTHVVRPQQRRPGHVHVAPRSSARQVNRGGVQQVIDQHATSHRTLGTSATDQPLIIFDWDDTLFPTATLKAFASTDRALTVLASMFDPTFSLTASTNQPVTEHVMRSLAELERAPQWKGTALTLSSSLPGVCDLRQHVWVVRDTLKAARALGRVAIVTMAEDGWVSKTATSFLPGVDFETLFTELDINIYYARRFGIHGQDSPVELKRRAMAECLSDLCGSGCAPSSVLSVGDAVHEQQAIKQLLQQPVDGHPFGQRPLCKTVKLMRKPSCAQLSKELQYVQSVLPRMVSFQSQFDVCVEDPEALRTLDKFALDVSET